MLPQLKKKKRENSKTLAYYSAEFLLDLFQILVVLLTATLTVVFNDSSFSNFLKASIFLGILFFWPLLVHQFS